jgi:uncharacterized protein (DUF362 family)/Pyruvate/2-oxoacid:ferredoxin oxidoreductase delta subunit
MLGLGKLRRSVVVTNKVYAVRCADYDQIDGAVEKLLSMMGGIDAYLSPKNRVALKANLLVAAKPEKCATTHPALVEAVGRLAKAEGAKPFVVDSPTGAYAHSEGTLKRLYRVTGMEAAAEQVGIGLNFDTACESVSYPEGDLIKTFDILAPLLDADVIFNLCKLKTHTFMAMTGAVKNMFGAIPGRAKPGFHAKLQEPTLFAQMLLDLAACTAPRLTIMDAVVGMEGNGPNSGTPRRVGLLLASENPLAVDVVAAEIMGLSLNRNPVLREARKRGLRPVELDQVELIGLDKSELRVADFQLPDTTGSGDGIAGTGLWQNIISPLFKSTFSLRPEVVKETCIACEDCYGICPVSAIDMVETDKRYAHIDDDTCIRCYCCHETCPQDAIDLRSNLLYRLIMPKPEGVHRER